MDTLELDSRLNTMIVQGKSVDALREFYAEDVVAQENDEPEGAGRDAWICAREEIAKKTRTFEAKVFANAANGDVSFSDRRTPWCRNSDDRPAIRPRRASDS